MLGREYVIDHCVSRLNLEAEEKLYRMYITDALKAISENTSAFMKNGKSISVRYTDLLNRMKTKESDEDSEEKADEIISRIKKKLGSIGGSDG